MAPDPTAETQARLAAGRAFTTRLGVSMAVGAAATVAFVVVELVQFGGRALATSIDETATIAASLIAALSAFEAARVTSGARRWAWTLLSASAASWCGGQFFRAVYASVAGSVLPFPSWADVPILVSTPLVVAGVLAFPAGPNAPPRNWRYWLDAAIVVTALVYMSWLLGLGQIVISFGDHLTSDLAGLATPLGDIVVTAALILAIRRTSYQQRDRMLLLLAGLAAITVANIWFGLVVDRQRVPVIGNILDAGWVAGYLLLALAAWWPSIDVSGASETPIDFRQMVLPWLAVLLAGITTLILAVSGHTLDLGATLLAGGLLALLMLSQVAAHRESAHLLIKSMRSEATLADVVERAPLGIARVLPDMTVVAANERFSELTRGNADFQPPVAMDKFMAAADVELMRAQLQALNPGSGRSAEGESQATRGDGTQAWLRWRATTAGDPSAGSTYYIAMFEDITATRSASEAAAANLAALDQMNQLKNEFMATFRNEFRTALVGIEGFTDLMQAGDTGPEEVQSYAGEILNEAHRLDRMIDELSDVEKVEAGRIALKMAAVDFNRVVTDAVNSIRTEGVRNKIVVLLDSSTPAVEGDRSLLYDLVRTLVGNAVQYSPKGGTIEVSTGCIAGFARACVKDQGLGARPDFNDRLFGQRDIYAESPLRKIYGTRLGLAMARRIVELHGGRLWVEQVDNEGSELYFTIPSV